MVGEPTGSHMPEQMIAVRPQQRKANRLGNSNRTCPSVQFGDRSRAERIEFRRKIGLADRLDVSGSRPASSTVGRREDEGGDARVTAGSAPADDRRARCSHRQSAGDRSGEYGRLVHDHRRRPGRDRPIAGWLGRAQPTATARPRLTGNRAGEKFHCATHLLQTLNQGKSISQMKPGDKVAVPIVAEADAPARVKYLRSTSAKRSSERLVRMISSWPSSTVLLPETKPSCPAGRPWWRASLRTRLHLRSSEVAGGEGEDPGQAAHPRPVRGIRSAGCGWA